MTALLLLGAAPLLSGCVAAVIPVLAGGAIVRSETRAPDPAPASASTAARAPAPAPATATAVGRATLIVGAAVPDPAASSAEPPGVAGAGAADDRSSGLAPPFAALLDHVQRRWRLAQEGAPIQALVLDDSRSVLDPVMLPCDTRPGAVLVDLDSDGRDNSAPLSASPGDWAAALAQLRALGAAILWVTARPADEAAVLAGALKSAGLDPAGADKVMGTAPGTERKQLVRQAAATRYCVLAVAGDTRADADEAYAFLRDPNAPLPVDNLWGQGWFLLPPALPVAGVNVPQAADAQAAKGEEG